MSHPSQIFIFLVNPCLTTTTTAPTTTTTKATTASCYDSCDKQCLARDCGGEPAAECRKRRPHDDLVELTTFTLTSEMSVLFPYEPDSSSAFTYCATICANVRHKRSGDS
ncbi:hypothetical protein HPB52_012876 [Rhipicephalus sanguineus]|uniref:Uncharacterized protein n=1 Tax=Rhipicephalus sanguineus TaxID=34632 RepID=A0A9D4QA16_RHISA|nr:hypothetical protein HPB52_012876 [Rhipicephalus sanguineus]